MGERVTALSPWLALMGLGAFHGINPAMGWLFSVALGLQHKSRATVLWSLLPIAVGHAASIAGVVALVASVRRVVDLDALRWTAAAILIAFGLYRLAARHKPRATGMQVGFADLTVWSFLMATGHGAGLMLVPVMLRLPMGDVHAAHMRWDGLPAMADAIGAFLAVAIHTLAMLAVAGVIAVVVYEWVGLAFLRRGWINLDLLWTVALFAAGAVLLMPALYVWTTKFTAERTYVVLGNRLNQPVSMRCTLTSNCALQPSAGGTAEAASGGRWPRRG
jgi:hypothetical protein